MEAIRERRRWFSSSCFESALFYSGDTVGFLWWFRFLRCVLTVFRGKTSLKNFLSARSRKSSRSWRVRSSSAMSMMYSLSGRRSSAQIRHRSEWRNALKYKGLAAFVIGNFGCCVCRLVVNVYYISRNDYISRKRGIVNLS